MKCPYCNEDMILGYIESRDGIFCEPKSHFVKALNRINKDAISLANRDDRLSSDSVYAYRCDNCKKVIIDYSRNK